MLLQSFFLIDTGIKRALDQTLSVELLPQTSAYGEAFEHWFILEVLKRTSYRQLDWLFSYLRTKHDTEIDLIITRPGEPRLLVEIKSKSRVTEDDARALERIAPQVDAHAELWLVSADPLTRKFGATTAMHWQQALRNWFG